MTNSIIWLQEPEQAAYEFRKFVAGDTSLLAFDTETTGLSVRNGLAVPRIIQFSYRPWNTALVIEVPDDDPEDWRYRFIQGMVGAASEIVGHNTKFDLHAMANYGYDWSEKPHHDTMWCARLYDERTSAKLKDLAVRYVRTDAADSQKELKALMRKNGWDWDTVPVEYLVEYGGNDAIITGELFDTLKPRIGYADEAYRREQRLSPILFRMERVGLTIDEELLAETTAEYEEKHAEAVKRLDELAPALNPNSPVQIKKKLAERGVEVPNTQAATLKQLDDEFAQTLLTYREVQKTLSTYLHPWAELIKATGRLHPWFNQLGTATGRFSSSDPNLQNITRGHVLRDLFVAAPGHKIVVADWNQMELRLYAHYAGDQNMIAAFLSGDDIYQQVADLLGVPRQIGKMIMLASIYGAGPRTIKAQCKTMALSYGMNELLEQIDKYDWNEMYERFHETYKIKQLARQCELSARKRMMIEEPYIRTWGGRRQRPKIVLRKETVNGKRPQVAIYKDLANSLVQGSSADLMKNALIDLDEAGYGEYLRLTVHDEVVMEVPDEKVPEVTAAVEAIMTRNEFVPPLTADAAVAQRYGDAK